MVHIGHIRNKIEKGPRNPQYIKTIRGIGYKFHKPGEITYEQENRKSIFSQLC